MVVLGHWVVNVPSYQGGEFFFTRILAVEPWTQFLTWLFQVMPVFFFVGGFSNAASWQKARHSHGELRAWQSRRMKRLLLPTSALVLFWSLAVAFASAVGVNPVLIRESSHAALLPAWFLAVYVMVTVAVPFTQKIWERTGLWSVASLTLAAVLVDIAAFVGGQDWIRWSNYAFIWLAVHQLGYWWQRATIRRFEPAALILLGGTALILLIAVFGYPVAMISVPGAEMSNTRPPTIAMIAIGYLQIGLLVSIAPRLNRWLQGVTVWTAVIIVSRRIMTIYLWHLTALLLMVGIAIAFGGIGLMSSEGSSTWWSLRPLWVLILAAALLVLIGVFGWFETWSTHRPEKPPGPALSMCGALIACAGLTIMALRGLYPESGLLLGLLPTVLCLAGSFLCSFRIPNS